MRDCQRPFLIENKAVLGDFEFPVNAISALLSTTSNMVNSNMAVTLKDIARDLGVSVITVSKALRDHSDISDETKARVLKRVKEMNYRPNLSARALVTGRTNLVGFVVPDLLHSFFSEIVRGLSSALHSSGYTLVTTSSEQDPKLERQAVEQLIARRVDALLVASTQWTVEMFRRVEEAGIPYILIDRSFTGLGAHFVGVNDEEVGALATRHLAEVGCQRIAHIGGAEISSLVGRKEGYKRVLAKLGLVADPELIYDVDRVQELGDEAGYNAAKKLLQLNPRPDGIFCYNDATAYGAMSAVLDAGLHVPEDIAIVGCGNLLYDKFLKIPLTSVDQQTMAIGQKAGKLALQLIEAGEPVPPQRVLLEPKLIVRQSTQRHSDRCPRAAIA
jgi:LacI family transcriptional regulator, galactose operon repressor